MRVRRIAGAGAAVAAAAFLAAGTMAPAQANGTGNGPLDGPGAKTATPIKHLVVIFGENVSFDHYFGTYPNAANPAVEPAFHAAPGTPTVNGLSPLLLNHNPNVMDGHQVNPTRLGRDQALTCDMDHNYKDEQVAVDRGLMDQFVPATNRTCKDPKHYSSPTQVLDYYDGNTVTAYWNYAQRFAMSDNSFDTNFGPSSPGAVNLVSGQTSGIYSVGADRRKTATPDPYVVIAPNADGVGTMINDPDPAWDDCSNASHNLAVMSGSNVGDMLNKQYVTWGWFQGGFRPQSYTDSSTYDQEFGKTAQCTAKHPIGAALGYTGEAGFTGDYNPHHEPFQYYKSTANPHHLPPTSVDMVGKQDQANHQYDMTDWYDALGNGNLPAVSFLKAANYQDGHAGYSDPLDEQQFVVNVVNKLQKSRDWASTAVVIAYDDSDGWYDHVVPPIVNASQTDQDALNAPGQCGTAEPMGGYQARCGYGPRLPLLVLSPYAKRNFVDGTITDQTSVLRFVEDNWLGGQRLGEASGAAIDKASFDTLANSLDAMFDWRHRDLRPLLLDPVTGQPAKGDHGA
ncbi:phospholipase C [Actinopolymorpha singaporensis]|uniref:phospholipase C n=1 Tax=Actinopolymorpha singaporensis TaxID=117157 RepID=A0A1H1PNC0_9ACTN|nr:alkaline phosphatase family protein [Actinopolymorpha singaporensis]SDS12594.1 phospholipase C [Actinopolymorpha singaporensis]